MKLISITKENWMEVIFLTTSENDIPTLCEEFVASNALSIVQAKYEETWITKAIEHEKKIVGFTMYGYCEEQNFYELCRVMIDIKYQGKGLGKQAINMILAEMKKNKDCKEVYLSTDSENIRAKRLYESIGFVNTGKFIDGEEQYCYNYKE